MPSHIKTSYRRFALVTSRDHLDQLGAGDEDTLIVSCDWLLWQRLLAEGRHAVYFELGLLGWTPPRNLDSDLFIRANDWIYDGKRDLTLFRGVSIGKIFSGEISMCLMNYYRLDRAIRNLIERFNPTDIMFFDYLNEISVLERAERRKIVEKACLDLSVGFEDRDPGIETSHLAEKIFAGNKESLLKRVFLAIYTRGLEAASNLRCMFKDRDKRIFVMVNSNLLAPLTETFRDNLLTPIFLCRTLPKQAGLLSRCLRYGVLLVTPREPCLTADDHLRLDQIQNDIETALEVPRNDVPDAVVSHVRAEILNTERFADAARKILMAERFFERYRPQRLVVDGVRNALPHVFIEEAHARGVEVDYIWHGPHTPHNKKQIALGGDPRTEPKVTRFLSWGRVSDAWLNDIGAKQPCIRVGCPLSKRYKGNPSPSRTTKGKALVLQSSPPVFDLRGLNANTFTHFVTVIRKLRELGIDDIVMKLHPGPGRWKKTYFETIADYFGLDCPVYKTRPYLEFLKPADIVVGPLVSGAMFETLAAGKPYYSFLMQPHGLNPSYYGDYPLLATAEDLPNALRKDFSESANRLLDDVYDLENTPNGAERFWEVLNGEFA